MAFALCSRSHKTLGSLMMAMKGLPGWLQAALAWSFIAGLAAGLGSSIQWVLFGTESEAGYAFLLRWPILWVLYFWFAIAITESVTRHIAKE